MHKLATEGELLAFLTAHQIPYQRATHPPVYTCEEADRYRPPMPGAHTKNLFLRDKHGSRFYLLMTDCAKRLNMKDLGRALNAPKLHFASEEQLFERLGLTPGAVTVLALVNDTGHAVRLLVDEEVWAEDYFLCHPLVNTSTLVLAKEDLLRFFSLTGHQPQVVSP